MATFTYECNNCDQERFEVTQSVHDKPLKKCKTCNKMSLKRIIVPGPSFRIGGLGVHKPTAHLKVDTKSFKRTRL